MAGAGYKLFNTGDVLTAAQVNTYLQEQVVMVFNDATARTTALSGVLAEGMVSYLKSTDAVEIYNGSAWVGIAADQTPLTTKGDLFTYSTTDARLAVGNDGETLVADSSATTGLRYNPSITGGKNAIINGGMDIWQRGTTVTNPGTSGSVFSADRWVHYFNGNGTASRETSVKPDTSTYSLKITATASSSSNDSYQLIEELQMEQFRGKTVTFSVKLAGTATLSPNINLAYSTTANDNLFNTSTGITADVVSTPAINASTFVTWVLRYTIPTTAKTLRIGIVSNTMANTNVLYIAEAQLEVGSTATAFSRAGGTLAGELAACQRYYFRQTAAGITEPYAQGFAYNTTGGYAVVAIPSNMRVKPTSVDVNNVQVSDWINNIAGTVTMGFCVANNVWLSFSGTGYTANRPYVLNASNATSHLGFSAEL